MKPWRHFLQRILTNKNNCSNSSESVTYPNFILINKPIANIHRSPDQWDAVEFHILANTSLERISILRNRIDKYVQSLPQIWYPQWRLIVRDIENTNKLRLLMTTQHHINFQVCPLNLLRQQNYFEVETVLLFLKRHELYAHRRQEIKISPLVILSH